MPVLVADPYEQPVSELSEDSPAEAQAAALAVDDASGPPNAVHVLLRKCRGLPAVDFRLFAARSWDAPLSRETKSRRECRKP